eukprot:UC4_evm1s212
MKSKLPSPLSNHTTRSAMAGVGELFGKGKPPQSRRSRENPIAVLPDACSKPRAHRPKGWSVGPTLHHPRLVS